MFVSALVLIVVAASAQPLLPYTDADNLDQAVAMIALEMRTIEETRSYCAREVQDQKRFFDHYALLWESQNLDETLAVETHISRRADHTRFEALREAAVSAAMVALHAASTLSGAERLCAATFLAIKSGDRNVATQTPKASQFLKDYLRDHPAPKEVIGKRDALMGCELQLSNKGIDLDTTRKSCACITDVMYRRASAQELDEIDEVAKAHGDVSKLPSFARMAPDLAACAAEVAK